MIVDGVFQVGATGLSPLGNQISFTGYDAATGVVSYSYTLLDNETHANGLGENNLFDDMAVILSDTDNDVDTDTLSISIVDDIPTANDDAFAIIEGDADNAITFDVDLNDVPGADGVRLVMTGGSSVPVSVMTRLAGSASPSVSVSV